ncbi:MAG: hypothetical protein EYC70_10305 [Planctomycetota bacterium]|nr:MAG: hypothetical protein EYC70_10305 [Planctomycetota bacterium]
MSALVLSSLLSLLSSTPAAGPQEPEIPAVMTLPDGRVLPARDRRDWAADPADDLATLDPAAQEQLDRLFAASIVRRAQGRAVPPTASARLQSLAQRAGAAVVPPPPGGVGYGFFFTEGTLNWSSSTASYQSMIAPRTPGGDVNTWLYNTTTNRSNLGVEAFISYFAQQDFHFKVFDWARYPAAPWQTDIVYGGLGEYISSVQNDDSTYRQELFAVNETFHGSGNNWTNRVWLENRVDDVLDLVYSYTYTLSNPNQNTYQTGDYFGSWAPIFETFQDHDGSNTPIGWNDFWLVQDGVMRGLTTGVSYARNDDPELFPPIFLTPNNAWAVGTTAGEPAVTAREAETGQHRIGQLNGDGWMAGPAHGTGLMFLGPPFNNVPGGRKNAEFRFKVDSLTGPGGALATYGVYDATTATVVAQDDLFLSDFNAANDYDPFRMDFNAVAGHNYRLVVRSYGLVNLTLDRVALVKN